MCRERPGHDMPSSNERAQELRLGCCCYCWCSVYVYDITTRLRAKEMFAISAGLSVRMTATLIPMISTFPFRPSLCVLIWYLLMSFPPTFRTGCSPQGRTFLRSFSLPVSACFLKVSFPFVLSLLISLSFSLSLFFLFSLSSLSSALSTSTATRNISFSCTAAFFQVSRTYTTWLP